MGSVSIQNKVRLRARHHRQEVTGVTVNDKLNVPKRFVNQIRAMLYIWKKHGLPAAQQTWEEKNTHKNRGTGKDVPRFEQVVKGKIEYLGMIKGKDCQTYLRFLDQLGEMDPKLTGGRGTPLRLLLQRYMRNSQTMIMEPVNARGLSVRGDNHRLARGGRLGSRKGGLVGILGLSRSMLASGWTAGIIWSSVNGQKPRRA